MTNDTFELSENELDNATGGAFSWPGGNLSGPNDQFPGKDMIAAPSDQDLANGLAMEGVEVGINGIGIPNDGTVV